MLALVACATATALWTSACTPGDGVAQRDSARTVGDTAAHAAPPPYAVTAPAQWGSVAGVVAADRALAQDTTVIPIGADSDCGTTLRIPLVEVRGGRLAGAVVSLDARVGKPLPAARRFELMHAHCAIEPHVQGVLAGGTLNVKSDDAAVVEMRFAHPESDSTLAMVRQTDAGQVVPVTGLFRQAGIIEVTSDTHPWMRAWIRVFDQPYFDVTDRRGAFRLDSVPPGTYQLSAWHDRLGTHTQTVTVRPGEETRVTVQF
ncbi:MAG TPA: carboxypeptidase-like regulatory domain-containing protein [Gemmatimonadaceae bacterium]|nr:carboxypeptidase-like regulatory domain-containing protein [Gemmatimonadaceae bacterium]